MDAAEVGIVTVTLARTPREEKLMRKSLGALTGLGLPIVAADGGSGPDFLMFLRESGIQVFSPKKPGLIQQVKLSFKKARERLGTPFLLYTEPDKIVFFGKKLSRFIRKTTPSGRFGLAFAARDKTSFQTFPPWQQFTESVINKISADLTGRKGDYCYGPILLPSAEAARIQDVPDDLGWGWRFHLLGQLHQEKRKAAHIELNLPCPPGQLQENARDRAYRTRQLRQNINGLSFGAAL